MVGGDSQPAPPAPHLVQTLCGDPHGGLARCSEGTVAAPPQSLKLSDGSP